MLDAGDGRDLARVGVAVLEGMALRQDVAEGAGAMDDDDVLPGLGDLRAQAGHALLVEDAVPCLVRDHAPSELDEDHRAFLYAQPIKGDAKSEFVFRRTAFA